MTLAIHEQGGLTDAEIQLRIEESADRQAAILEQKLKEHADAIDRRLETTDQALRDVASQTSDLKADVAVLMASDKQQTQLLQQISANGDKWHEADIDFRAVLVQRVSKIETEQTKLSSQMALLRWMVAVSSVTVKSVRFALETESVRTLLVIGLLLGLAHTFAPTIYLIVRHLLEATK